MFYLFNEGSLFNLNLLILKPFDYITCLGKVGGPSLSLLIDTCGITFNAIEICAKTEKKNGCKATVTQTDI